MVGKDVTLGLVAEDLAGLHGAAIAGVDVIIALLATGSKVFAITRYKPEIEMSRLPRGRQAGSPEWFLVPRDIPFPTRLNRKFPRYAAGWVKQKLLDKIKREKLKRFNPELTFVNSFFFSHDLLFSLDHPIDGKKALIVHESTRHFKVHDESHNLDWGVAAMNRYDALIFVSRRSRDEWMSLSSFPGKKIFCIPNCCREHLTTKLLSESREQVRERLGLPPDKFIVVCAANVQYRKGQDLLLDHYNDIVNVAPEMAMYWVGPIVYDGDAIYRRLQSGDYHNLQFLGARRNAMDYIRAADVMVLPSRAEAMPLVILEAMALKTPVIASDVDGIPELIENDKEGLLFSHENPEGLVSAFARMYSTPDTRQAFAERAYEKYWTHFSRAQHIRRYGEVIERILNPSSMV